MLTISNDDIIRRLETENPWWVEPYTIPKSMEDMRPRAYFNLFYPLVESRKVKRAVVLMGPRRVGKTVLIHHAIQKLLAEKTDPKKICYFSVDHPIYTGMGLERYLDYYGQATGLDWTKDEVFIFFDEIQYLKEWEIHLKAIVDRFPNVKCVVSGSAAAALRFKSMESGAGRFTDFLLPPLTFYEYLELLNRVDLVDPIRFLSGNDWVHFKELNENFLHYINFGGYPEVVFSEEIQSDPGRFIKKDIVDKVLLRDLPGLYGIQDVQELNYLFTTLAYNTSNEISLEELSKGSGVAKNTIKRYIEYLEAAFLIRVVHRVDINAKRFQRANFFKVYLTNPSLRSALFTPVTAESKEMGGLTETAIFSQWFHSETAGNIHYARWAGGEVDIVHLRENQNAESPMEVKWSDRVFDHPEDLKSLQWFCQKNKIDKATVTTISKLGDRKLGQLTVNFVPASLYCNIIGSAIIEGKVASQWINL